MSSKFAVGDRVEFAPTVGDTTYEGDLEQYRGEKGTLVDVETDESDAFFAGLFGMDMPVVGVIWDNEAVYNAAEHSSGEQPGESAAFEANIQKIEGGN